jgi:hypothetical protein
LLRAWFGNIACVLLPDRVFNIWGGYAYCTNYPPVRRATGLYFDQAIIRGQKNTRILTQKDSRGNRMQQAGFRRDCGENWPPY